MPTAKSGWRLIYHALCSTSPPTCNTSKASARGLPQILLEKGITTVEDLLYYLPFRYEDRLNPRGIGELRAGEMASIVAEVRTFGLFRTRRMPLFEMTVGQGRDTLKCVWFNAAYLQDKFRAGHDGRALRQGGDGRLRGGQRLQIIQPQFEILHDPTAKRQARGEESKWQSLEVGRIVPIYEAAGKGQAHGALVSPRDSRHAGEPRRPTFPTRFRRRARAHGPDRARDARFGRRTGRRSARAWRSCRRRARRRCSG